MCVLPLLDGDARRTQTIYPSSSQEGPTSSGVGEIVLSCTEAFVQGRIQADKSGLRGEGLELGTLSVHGSSSMRLGF
jgi:hypothetical protein